MHESRNVFLARYSVLRLSIYSLIRTSEQLSRRDVVASSICNSFVELGETILNLAGIPTGAGPSGPVSGGPTNTPAIEAWTIGVESIRARLCDMLMKPE